MIKYIIYIVFFFVTIYSLTKDIGFSFALAFVLGFFAGILNAILGELEKLNERFEVSEPSQKKTFDERIEELKNKRQNQS